MTRSSIVSIVIPHWSPLGNPLGRQALIQCLASIMRQSYSPLEVIVVNNEGEGDWVCDVQEKFAIVQWIHNQQNRLFTGAMNQGIVISKGEFVLSLNNDVILSPDFIQESALVMKKDEKIGMVCGLLLWSERVGDQSSEKIDSAGQALSRSKRPCERGHGCLNRNQFNQIEEVFGVPGACGMYRRQMLEEIALSRGEYFDRSFGLFYEDLELAWRAQKKGWKGFFVPTAIAYHVRGLTTKVHLPRWGWLKRFHAANLGREDASRLIRNRQITLHRHNSWLKWILHFPWILAYDLALHLIGWLAIETKNDCKN